MYTEKEKQILQTLGDLENEYKSLLRDEDEDEDDKPRKKRPSYEISDSGLSSLRASEIRLAYDSLNNLKNAIKARAMRRLERMSLEGRIEALIKEQHPGVRDIKWNVDFKVEKVYEEDHHLGGDVPRVNTQSQYTRGDDDEDEDMYM